MRRTLLVIGAVVASMSAAFVPAGLGAAATPTPPEAAAAPSGGAVDIDYTIDEAGYWVTFDDGRVVPHNAPDFGGTPSLGSNERITSLSPTPSGRGYWLFSDRGRVFPFGDAPHWGDLSTTLTDAGVPVSEILNGPVVGSTSTPTGGGYWMVASDGGIFAFGDAEFFGSMGGQTLNGPVVGLAPTPTNAGYWLVATDGGIFAFGDAGFFGSMGGQPLNQPVTSMIPQGAGYLMVATDGGIFNFGDSNFWGSLGGQDVPAPVVAATVRNDLDGYLLLDASGGTYPFGGASVLDESVSTLGDAPVLGAHVETRTTAEIGDLDPDLETQTVALDSTEGVHVGDLLAVEPGEGLRSGWLGRVDAVQDGAVTVRRAGLSDLTPVGSIDMTVPLVDPVLVLDDGTEIALEASDDGSFEAASLFNWVRVFDAGALLVEAADCGAEIDGDVSLTITPHVTDVDVDLDWGYLSGTAQLSADLRVEVKVGWEGFLGARCEAELSLLPGKLVFAPIPVPGLPAWVSPTFDLDAKIGIDAGISSSVGVSFDIVQYPCIQQRFGSVIGVAPSLCSSDATTWGRLELDGLWPPAVDTDIGVGLEGEIQLQLGLELYSVAGPFISPVFGLGLETDFSGLGGDPWWKLTASTFANLGFKVDFFVLPKLDGEISLPKAEYTLAQADGPWGDEPPRPPSPLPEPRLGGEVPISDDAREVYAAEADGDIVHVLADAGERRLIIESRRVSDGAQLSSTTFDPPIEFGPNGFVIWAHPAGGGRFVLLAESYDDDLRPSCEIVLVERSGAQVNTATVPSTTCTRLWSSVDVGAGVLAVATSDRQFDDGVPAGVRIRTFRLADLSALGSELVDPSTPARPVPSAAGVAVHGNGDVSLLAKTTERGSLSREDSHIVYRFDEALKLRWGPHELDDFGSNGTRICAVDDAYALVSLSNWQNTGEGDTAYVYDSAGLVTQNGRPSYLYSDCSGDGSGRVVALNGLSFANGLLYVIDGRTGREIGTLDLPGAGRGTNFNGLGTSDGRFLLSRGNDAIVLIDW